MCSGCRKECSQLPNFSGQAWASIGKSSKCIGHSARTVSLEAGRMKGHKAMLYVLLCTITYSYVPLCTFVYHFVPLYIPLCTVTYRYVPLRTIMYCCVPVYTGMYEYHCIMYYAHKVFMGSSGAHMSLTKTGRRCTLDLMQHPLFFLDQFFLTWSLGTPRWSTVLLHPSCLPYSPHFCHLELQGSKNMDCVQVPEDRVGKHRPGPKPPLVLPFICHNH